MILQLLQTGSHQNQSWRYAEQETVTTKRVEGAGLESSRKGLPVSQKAHDKGARKRVLWPRAAYDTPTLGVRSSKDMKPPNTFAFCRSKAPRSALGAEIGVRGRQTPSCMLHPGWAAAHRLLLGCPVPAAEEVVRPSMTFPLPTSGSACWQAARAALQDPVSPWPRSLAPQDTAQQTVTCPPLRGLVSYDPTQGAYERSSRSQVSPCFYFRHFILSGSKWWVSNPAFSFCGSPLPVPAAL